VEISAWIREKLQKAEAAGLVRNPLIEPTPPQVHKPGEPKKKKRRRKRPKSRQKSPPKTAGRDSAPGNAEKPNTPLKPESKEGQEGGPSPDAAPLTLHDMVYSARMHQLLVEKGLPGKQLDNLMIDAKRRATLILEELRRKAEEEREERERKGVLARLDYLDKIDFGKNFVPYTARELGKMFPFELVYRKILLAKDLEPLPDEEADHFAQRKEKQRLRLEADKQAMQEVIVRAYDVLTPLRQKGTEEAAHMVTATMRSVMVRGKMRHIWEAAEKKAKEDVLREERERIEALKTKYESTVWLEMEVFAIQSYSACLKLRSPAWAFVQKQSLDFSLGLVVRMDHPRIFVEIVNTEKVRPRFYRSTGRRVIRTDFDASSADGGHAGRSYQGRGLGSAQAGDALPDRDPDVPGYG
jgi:hypothetical protein